MEGEHGDVSGSHAGLAMLGDTEMFIMETEAEEIGPGQVASEDALGQSLLNNNPNTGS